MGKIKIKVSQSKDRADVIIKDVNKVEARYAFIALINAYYKNGVRLETMHNMIDEYGKDYA